ncbi:MAG: hypothetical protein M3209_00295 [Acidobacteriota bacterium]|nr:hypothetical protein [Acidobacteriota bacterium]
MPKRVAADSAQVLAVYAECKSGRETARRLGLHDNTVYAILRRAKGQCAICGKPAGYEQKHCSECKVKVNERAKNKRARRRQAGLCEACDSPYEAPSRKFCRAHWLQDKQLRQTYREQAKVKRGTPQKGVPNQTQREAELLRKYGQDAVEVWRELKGSCVICNATYSQKSICLHHIDGNHENNVKENFTLLCFRCHKLVHLFIEHEQPDSALQWIKQTYPQTFVLD